MQNKLIKVNKKVFQLIGLLALVVIVIFLLVKSFHRPDMGGYILEPENKTEQEVNVKFKDMTKIIESENFQSLVKFGDWPLTVSEKGRPNPFLSY